MVGREEDGNDDGSNGWLEVDFEAGGSLWPDRLSEWGLLWLVVVSGGGGGGGLFFGYLPT